MYLLDTNICIYALKRNPPAIIERLRELTTDAVAVSLVTACELRFGAAKATSRATKAAITGFLAEMPVLPLADGIDAVYAKIRLTLERRGLPIGPMDLLIAAHAVALDATLVTNNEREFRRVTGLRVENWV